MADFADEMQLQDGAVKSVRFFLDRRKKELETGKLRQCAQAAPSTTDPGA
jgi:hypothetical protein